MSKILDLVLAGTTPQFDADTSLATTEFLQRALGNSRGYVGYTADVTLGASDAGKEIYLSTTLAPIVVTLPGADDFPAGTTFRMLNTGVNDVTINRAGADTIVLGHTSNTVTSITLKPGDWICLKSLGSGTLWYHAGGSSQLKYAGQFDATLGASWSQRLPSGLILKGGTGSITTNTTILFPVAFPNNCYSVSMTPGANVTPGNYSIDMSGFSVAGFIGSAYVSSTGAAATRNINYLAVGD